MAGKKSRVKRKDLRKQRWAGIIAGILALAMAISAIAAYAGHLLDRGSSGDPGQEQQIDSQAARKMCLDEIERLKKYIDDMETTAPVLGRLVEYYAFLIQLEEEEGEEKRVSEETLQGYRDDLLFYNHELVELEPKQPLHRLQLLENYHKYGGSETVIAGEIDVLRALIHENPSPSSSLMLIGFMKSSKQQEEMIAEEAAWLKDHLEQLEAEDKLDSENRYYYAYLMGEYLDDIQTAKEQLGLIMKEEPEESSIYSAAKGYLEQLEKEKETGSEEE